jgi:hypothetical protein
VSSAASGGLSRRFHHRRFAAARRCEGSSCSPSIRYSAKRSAICRPRFVGPGALGNGLVSHPSSRGEDDQCAPRQALRQVLASPSNAARLCPRQLDCDRRPSHGSCPPITRDIINTSVYNRDI